MTAERDRFEATEGARLMRAVVTTGNGGYERLELRDVPVPVPGPGEVLLRVLAAGVNNTEINTRLGWYSAAVTSDTAGTSVTQDDQRPDGGWNAPTPFPFIQGADCCGRVVEVGPGVDPERVGDRVLVRSCMRQADAAEQAGVWLGVDVDGAFAEYLAVPADEAFTVESDWSDAELATVPCAYGTAENMLQRAGVSAGERVLVTGASGGVGSALVQLARRRGAHVTAIAGRAKLEPLRALGAERTLPRGEDPVAALGEQSVDVVLDTVGGPEVPALLAVLRRGGRYATCGAIAGPIVSLDLRTLYLKDLTMFGSTTWDEGVFGDLVSYVERGEIRPVLAQTFPLDRIVEAQEAFLAKRHVGKLVLLPPAEDDHTTRGS
ncbi:alcohol dehydrogenase family protein [Actinotalea sp.]|uniref:alcohol dehydrogenase family protein n=1 Tax=Actinotalea sp. TaxID=1872145 RepID=UPI0035693D8E